MINITQEKHSFITLSSLAEDLFIQTFSDVFGIENTKYLVIQHPFVDIYGNSRYIDFALKSDNEKIAIEIDGETYHNPKKVSSEKYYDDLLKQNSLIFDKWKVYRWAYNQLKNNPEQVKDQLLTFLGELPLFKAIEDFLPQQKGEAFVLKEHQEEAMEKLEEMRSKGESIALLYHATGTGKTVTAVSDAKRMGKRTLLLAHTKELLYQAKDKFSEIWSDVDTGLYVAENREKDSYVVCGSIQSVSQNIEQFNHDDFGYLIIDEAHHGAAESYKKILGHFKPKFTLGLTATPERADGEDILNIFKNVAHRMDLKTAVEIGELVPIRCIRVKTNVDISNVRFNGIKYNSQDLESKLFIPERNKVIVDTYLNYVKDKKTVIFCVSVKHAEEVAALLRDNGIKAEAVSGVMKSNKRQRTLEQYENGDISVLCACDLLNEGWDSPRTQVLFMARPTMSKTIYMQQLGRGTRKSEGKDYLMVFDFIDNASLFNSPLSMHRMFDINKYKPGEFVLASGKQRQLDEDLFRKGERPDVYLDFPVDVYDYETIDLFNWQDHVKDMISQIEFVRRVDVQSETVARYIREGKIVPDYQVPMGNSVFNFFYYKSVERYAKEFGWDMINAANMQDKFMEMIEKMDMSYSYKPVLLKAMLDHCDEKGRVLVDDIIDYFTDYYSDRKSKGLVVEKSNSPYCREEVERRAIKNNIFSNPFKRFEDMGFMKKCQDVNYVQFNSHIWKKLTKEEKVWIVKWSDKKLEEYYMRFNK